MSDQANRRDFLKTASWPVPRSHCLASGRKSKSQGVLVPAHANGRFVAR